MSINGEIETILREDLWITVDGDATAYIPDKDFDDATKKIVSLIKERYVEKKKEGMYDCLDETCSTLKRLVVENKSLFTPQKAYEKAMTALFGDEWRKMFRAEIVSDADKSLRNAFGIKEEKL